MNNFGNVKVIRGFFLIIFWLISIVGCVGCCCMLKKDKYEDDEVTCSDSKNACMCWFCEP